MLQDPYLGGSPDIVEVEPDIVIATAGRRIGTSGLICVGYAKMRRAEKR